MDSNVDPRIFLDHNDPRNCISRSISVNNDPMITMRDPNARISLRDNQRMSLRSDTRQSMRDHDPRMSMRESIILEEHKPLKRKGCSHMRKPPVNHRQHSCTDVHCLLIFACFIAAWIYIASYAVQNGNLNKFLIPVDSKNAKCGLDSGVRNKTKLFFFSLDKCLDPVALITGCETKQICVESCPKKSFLWQENGQEQKDLQAIKEDLICDNSVQKDKLSTLNDIKQNIAEERCSRWYMPSKPFFNHCLWDFSSNFCGFLSKLKLDKMYDNFVNHTNSWCKNQTQQNISVMQQPEPSNFNRIVTAIISKFNYGGKEISAEHIAVDLKNSYKIMLVAFVIHIFAVLIFITLLRWVAGPIVWISIVGVLCGLSFSLFYSLREYKHWKEEPHVPHHNTNLLAKIQNVSENENLWLWVSIVLGVVIIIISLILLVIRKRIKIAIAIIKEASKAITAIKSSIFFPIFPGILYIIVLVLAWTIYTYLSSIGEYSFLMVRRKDTMEKCICDGPTESAPYKLNSTCIPELFEQYCHVENHIDQPCLETSCSFNEIVRAKKTNWFIIFNVFGSAWALFFISAYQDMVLACCFSMWYWTFNKKDIPRLPLLKAIWITTKYHLGTLAFGSLILTICRMIRYILDAMEKKLKVYDSKLAKAVLCCMKCFFWLLENLLRFLNRNAYITCAIHSTSFCASSKKAFTLITQNILRVYAVDRVSVFIFFLSKILVTGCTSCATYFFLIYCPNVVPVNYPLVPVALVAVTSYVMADVIFSTYSMAVDTLFFCFLEDSTENDGSAEKPFYMSKNLNKLLGKKKSKKSKQIRNDFILQH